MDFSISASGSGGRAFRKGRLIRLPWTLLLLAVQALFTLPNRAGQVICRLHGMSIRVQAVETNVAGSNFSLSLGSGSLHADNPNGELAPVKSPGDANDFGTYYVLKAPPLGTVVDDFSLSPPDYQDADDNGLNDFFQPEFGDSGVSSSGIIEDGFQGTFYPVHATWYRDAGSRTGVCRMRLQNPNVHPIVTFVVPYEIREFAGVLDYQKSGSAISGELGIAESGHPNNTLRGVINFQRLGTDELELLPGAWTNGAGQSIRFSASGRLHRHHDDYVGFILFQDLNPATPDPDYTSWAIRITDSHHGPGGEIPDFSSDAPTLAPPLLHLALGSGALHLGIEGVLGAGYTIEETVSLSPPRWAESTNLTLTRAFQDLPSSLPDAPQRFWRARLR